MGLTAPSCALLAPRPPLSSCARYAGFLHAAACGQALPGRAFSELLAPQHLQPPFFFSIPPVIGGQLGVHPESGSLAEPVTFRKYKLGVQSLTSTGAPPASSLRLPVRTEAATPQQLPQADTETEKATQEAKCPRRGRTAAGQRERTLASESDPFGSAPFRVHRNVAHLSVLSDSELLCVCVCDSCILKPSLEGTGGRAFCPGLPAPALPAVSEGVSGLPFENTAIFMCKCCNLFSPSQSELLSHVSEKHAEEGINVDEIVIPLRPLSTPEPTNPGRSGDETQKIRVSNQKSRELLVKICLNKTVSLTSLRPVPVGGCKDYVKAYSDCTKDDAWYRGDKFSVMKRKRGRPKGSTKKPSPEEELAENIVMPSEGSPRGPEEGRSLTPSSLECGKCGRKFSNTRQLRKHVCIVVLSLGEEEGEAGNESDLELEKKCKEDDREKAPKRPRTQRAEKVQKVSSGKEAAQISGAKKPIISVVLTAHEAIPGATKIVPVEAGPPETGATDPEATAADLAPRRGYQEYAIQQTPYEQPMKSSRLGPTQLKIFTCEYCNKVFKFKHSLQAHLRIHTNEKPYKCSQCSYASAIKANLNVHLRKHTGEKFACDYCSFTCLSKGHLKVHIERVHKKIKQHCRFCKKKYSDVKNLIKHIRGAHDPQDGKVKEALDELCLMTREGKRQLLYDCHVCERKFKNELDRDRHMLVHGDKWPFACELCGHGATKYQALELHKFVSSIRLRSHIKEAHGAAQETLVFTSSINQSFCLLEPGGDIQQEALGGQLQLAEEEFVFQGGRGTPETPVEVPAPPLPCELAASEGASDLHPHSVVSDEFLLKNDASSAEAPEAPAKTLDTQQGGSAQPQGEDVTPLLPKAKDPSRCLRSNPAEASDLPPGAGGRDAALCQPDSCTPAPEHRAGITAFMRILDSLQKRRMNPGLCERIRKVYGDLECEYCEVSMSTISEVLGRRVQLKGLIGKRAMKCPYCDFYFMKNGSDLQRHIWAHEGCGERIQKVKSYVETEQGEEGWVKPFKCSLCEYATRSKSNLKAHMNRHSTEKTHLCDMCGKKFKSKGTLKSHKLLHTADGKQFKCTVCDYTAAQKPQLLRHMEQHASFKDGDFCSTVPSSCVDLACVTRIQGGDFCSTVPSSCVARSSEGHFAIDLPRSGGTARVGVGHSFIRQVSLTVGGDGGVQVQPFRCAHCHYSCNISGSLKRHYNRKHPSEEYTNVGTGELAADALIQQGGLKCPVCSFVYGTKWEFNRHLKNKHGLKLVENEGDPKWEPATETPEEPSTQYLHITEAEEDVQGTQAAVAALQDLRYTSESGDRLDPTAVNFLQQIIELGTETHDATAVASVVAMAPGTVTVVKQTDVFVAGDTPTLCCVQLVDILGHPPEEAEEHRTHGHLPRGVGSWVTDEEPSSNHTVMIQETLQQASVGLAEQHHLVVSSDDVEGIETVTVYTQGGEASEFIVYVQEAVQPVGEPAVGPPVQEP
ncbi:zinc finger protein 406-like protein [Camelus ferus]|nr:zinc finger protein 406-like protein [Camelus ferus]